MAFHLVVVASPDVGSVLTAFAFPRIQSKQHHHAVDESVTPHSPELSMSAI